MPVKEEEDNITSAKINDAIISFALCQKTKKSEFYCSSNI